MGARMDPMRWAIGPLHGYCDNPLICFLLAAVAAAFVVALGFLVAGLRSGIVGVAAYREIRRLPRAAWPAKLATAAAADGIPRLVFLELTEPTAFCAGLLRPTVFISAGAVASLTPEQLNGVLVHEADHARSHEPMRRTLRQSFAYGFFYLPVVRWWARYQGERAELRADRAALATVGAKAVAGALLATNWGGPARFATGFSGGAEARVAQILGDPVPARRPPAWAVLVSIAGFSAAVWLAHCVAGGGLSALS